MDAPHIGRLAAGPRNSIADVEGVTVGHCTLDDGPVQTGVTVVSPHGGNLFAHKLPAAAVVINGFGKSAGLVQLEELGTLETPIALTNTFAVGTIVTAQIRHALQANPEIGRSQPTVNPLVMECNDGYLNDLHAFAVQEAHFRQALAALSADVQQGAVGAGRGMSSFGMKGGIGSASRIVAVGAGDNAFTVGALVLSNFGRLQDLILDGQPLGRALAMAVAEPAEQAPEKGSIIMLLATDAPLDGRQLKRLSTRAGAGLARTGSVYGHGSGDIALAFSTAQQIEAGNECLNMALLPDHLLDPLFHAAADSVEQAIVNALFAAQTVRGRDGRVRECLRERLARLPS
ncbi:MULTISPECIES: P1 family peptidase [unclassified Herbaspirillum]|uniref:DmpA family aminopeptidase n=1 Tax=unclassified Herbaspirillum TaxID=2624150 RepID=UPI0011546649|nr:MULTISPECIES: P1 family peptidase [unclassified Herbaspirillum]MBB5390820.1 D-aminopeptidase [Herbaspirillum sp. SJZ102]TQK06349.1 D-aminopeptidase [Herbaspirillum sp. SJZ130]TQK12173.1 D-aminopeptidase [Herbaspirillum sp. SJZ106]